MHRDYLNDYGGPDVIVWSGDGAEPDWAALYPIPESRCSKELNTKEDRPAKRQRREHQAEDDSQGSDGASDVEEEEEEEEEVCFWLSPRMACRLHYAGSLCVDDYCRGDLRKFGLEDMPGVVKPYAQRKVWMEAYTQTAMRLIRRLEKGLEPQPNCTAEEFALHMIIGLAKDFCEDGVDDAIADVIETLPHTILDEDFDLVLFAAFQDHDVLMLFDMPQVIHPNGFTQMTGLANLHPEDWFKPFQPHLTSNHV